jgi:adenine-specific DNA-methyltransferase
LPENEIKNKVLNVLEIKKEDPIADTQVLEQEIDRIVYELYGLSEEESKIILGSRI